MAGATAVTMDESYPSFSCHRLGLFWRSFRNGPRLSSLAGAEGGVRGVPALFDLMRGPSRLPQPTGVCVGEAYAGEQATNGAF